MNREMQSERQRERASYVFYIMSDPVFFLEYQLYTSPFTFKNALTATTIITYKQSRSTKHVNPILNIFKNKLFNNNNNLMK